MQMRKFFFQSNNRHQRAAQHTRDANECLEAGFRDLAYINAQMAALERGEDWTQVERL